MNRQLVLEKNRCIIGKCFLINSVEIYEKFRDCTKKF